MANDDKIIISLEQVLDAIAAELVKKLGADPTHIYLSPMQQETLYPAWFIEFMPNNELNRATVKRYMRTLNLDIIYIEDRSKPNLYIDYVNQADLLDEKFAPPFLDFPYTYTDIAGVERTAYTKLRVFNRKWTIDPNALHYKFTIEFLANRTPDEEYPKMLVIEELNERITYWEGWNK